MGKKDKLTGKPNVMKEVNKGLIQDTLLKVESATRVEIAAMTKISQPTVNAIMKEMVKENTVVEVGYAISSGGRKAMQYALNQNFANIAAIIARPQELVYEIADLFGRSLEKGTAEIDPTQSYLDNLTQLSTRLTERNRQIKALTVGVPAAVSDQGEIFAVPQIPELEGCQLQENLSSQFGINVRVVNDINTIAFGYYRTGVSRKQEDMVFIHIGEGLGASVIIGGRVLNGFSSFAGEIGYMKVGDEDDIEKALFAGTDQVKNNQMIARIVVNTICLVNPPTIVLGGSYISTGLIDEVRSYCRSKIPAGMIPEFMSLEDEQRFYLEGAIQTAIDTVREGIRLIVN